VGKNTPRSLPEYSDKVSTAAVFPRMLEFHSKKRVNLVSEMSQPVLNYDGIAAAR
jgi:hypothetical protein